MTNPVIIALDVASRSELEQILQKPLSDMKPFIKIGMELFYQEGPEIVKELKEEGYDIFLDIKLHDIPTTVKKAMRGLAKLGVDMVNVHAAGGAKMMAEALTGLEEGTPSGKKRPLCIAVTQLTSTDQEMLEKELLIDLPLEKVVESYARLAYRSGLDGVVCSPWEASVAKHVTSQEFLTVTPGIRLAGNDAHDQKRVATPAKARELGSDYIVVGRSITNAKSPVLAYQQILNEWSHSHVQL
ncbi:MAG: orotidine-5'-phosphate decarboxylase [Tuberibacillus sp.]